MAACFRSICSTVPKNLPPPARPSSLLDNLNDEQLAAVTLPAGHALILAGAGSGKTRVLTTRIAWLLQRQVTPGGILAVTFTNKAAKEMLARLSAMLPYNVRGMWIGTFHGLCNRLLRAHHKAAGLPPPSRSWTRRTSSRPSSACASSSRWTRSAFRPSSCLLHRRLQGRRHAPRDVVAPTPTPRRSSSTSSTRSSASAKAWSISAS
jgi:hypothetical protein